MIVPGEGHPTEDTISLLQCLLEKSEIPHHIKKDCGTNDCPRCEYDVWAAELRAPYKPKRNDVRAFPMLDGERSIPWGVAGAIWEHMYAKLFPGEQTLTRLAERGGFSWEEIQMMARLMKQKGLL